MKFVSTVAFNNDFETYLNYFEDSDIGVEFSSGGTISGQKNIDYFRNFGGKKIIHNYFPGYSKPFVLNIASTDKKVLSRSIKHCKNSILETSAQSSQKIFAVHAGFKVDPDPSELGKKIDQKKMDKPEEAKCIFLESLIEIISYAEEHNVELLIENNVLTKENYKFEIPFFCVESKEITNIFEELSNFKNFGLLLDTAHLKVSTNTLNLNIENEVNRISSYIKAIHHSDNDGYQDSNFPINDKYWFLPYNRNFLELPHVLEVKNQAINEIVGQLALL